MKYTNITINGLKMPIEEKFTIADLIKKFFDLRCETLVVRNSQPVPTNKYQTCKIRENDTLQVLTYSTYYAKTQRRIIFRPEE